MTGFKRLPRFAAAALFALAATGGTLISSATHAGEPASRFSAAAAPADAAVAIAVGIGFGAPHRYYRYYDRGGAWVRFGYGYAPAPGYARGYYLGYGPPPFYRYARPYRPYYGYRPYYRPYGYRHYGYRHYYGRYGY